MNGDDRRARAQGTEPVDDPAMSSHSIVISQRRMFPPSATVDGPVLSSIKLE